MNIIQKALVVIILINSSIMLVAQEERKGSYLGISGNIGSSYLDYDLTSLNEEGTVNSKPGYGVELKYSYFFNYHWGISTGVGISHYASVGKLAGGITDGSYYSLGMLTDDDEAGRPRTYELRARLSNLEEKQTTYLLEIPLMMTYQTFFGERERWGIYGSLGVKLQFPVKTKFSIKNGAGSQLNVSGYYTDIPTDMGSPSNPPVVQHGYGTINDPNNLLNWDDDAKLKMGVAGAAELGFLFAVGKTTDLMIGGYIDYGFSDLKKNKNQGLFTAPAVYHPGADNKIGNGIKYNGMLNSDVTEKIKALSFGGKVTLRFKVGK